MFWNSVNSAGEEVHLKNMTWFLAFFVGGGGGGGLPQDVSKRVRITMTTNTEFKKTKKEKQI